MIYTHLKRAVAVLAATTILGASPARLLADHSNSDANKFETKTRSST